MAHVHRFTAVAAILWSASFCAACQGCKTEKQQAPTPDLDKPTADIQTKYTAIADTLKRTKGLWRPKGPIDPWVPSDQPAIEIDEIGRLHVLRTSVNENSRQPVAVEYGILEAGVEPVWRRIAQFYEAGSPTLLRDRNRTIAAIEGATSTDFAFEALIWFPIAPAEEAKLRVCIPRVAANVRLASDPDGRILALTQQDRDPLALPKYSGLRIQLCANDRFQSLVDPISGTAHPKTLPEDYAIHSDTQGMIHVVYKGVRTEAENLGPQLWHLTLDSNGALKSARALAPGTRSTRLLKIITAPDKQLYVVELHSPPSDISALSQNMVHRVFRLDAQASEDGAPATYFVDPWLQVHVVWFENNEPRYFGPRTFGTAKQQ